MFINKIKNRIVVLLIFSMIISSFCGVDMYAGEWKTNVYGLMNYIGENGKYAINEWRWIDDDGDSVAECYRFNEAGVLIASAYAPDGRFVNKNGQWEIDGIVQKVYFNNFKPLKSNSKGFVFTPEISTYSGTRRLNASGKDLDKIQEDKDNKNENKKTQYDSPIIGTMSIVDGMIKTKKVLKPVIEATTNRIIRTYTPEDENNNVTASDGKYIPGLDVTKKISASNKFTKDVESANIYGGDVWEHCMCLSGNGAYLKVLLEKMNYMRVEVAHQKHAASTDETVCYLELYIDGEFIETFDSFVDGEPLVIEEWFDEGEKTFELKWVVESGAQGRKLYLRDGRLRKIKDSD